MNDILTSLHRRKSVRVFTGEPVSGEIKEAVLAAAAQAPTAGCQQLYTVLDITDQALKDRLAKVAVRRIGERDRPKWRSWPCRRIRAGRRR